MRFRHSLRLEKIQSSEAQLFVLRRFRLSAFSFFWHYHPEVEITLIRRGGGLRYVGRSVERYGPGDFCLLTPDTPHTWSSAPGSGPAEATVIQFLPASWGEGVWRLREFQEVGRFLAQPGGGWRALGRTRDRAVRLVDELEDLPLLSARRASLFWELLALLTEGGELRPIQLGGPRLPVRGGGSDPRLQAVLGYVEANSMREISHAEVAARVRLSPAAFCRFIKRRMGKTFVQHLNEVRVAKICGQLADTSRGVTEIAFACGYNNLSHFNRQFKALAGCTPREYRRRAGAQEPAGASRRGSGSPALGRGRS